VSVGLVRASLALFTLVLALSAATPARAYIATDVIRRVVREHLPHVQACYQQALSGRSDLRGQITVRFVIEARGVVSSAEATRDDPGAPAMTMCVLDAVRRMVFPPHDPSRGSVTVNYPFRFEPGA
jgi:TonB family protein